MRSESFTKAGIVASLIVASLMTVWLAVIVWTGGPQPATPAAPAPVTTVAPTAPPTTETISQTLGTMLANNMDTQAERDVIVGVQTQTGNETYHIDTAWGAADVHDPAKQQLALAICTKATTIWDHQPLAVTDRDGTVAFAVTTHMQKQDGTGDWYECVTGDEQERLENGESIKRDGYLIAPPSAGESLPLVSS